MAAWGSSKEPGTQCSSTRSGPTPPAPSAATAPSASFFEIASLKRAAMTAKRPAACRLARSDGLGARPATLVREGGEEMAHLLALGQEVSPVALGGRDLDGHALDHLEPIALDADDLFRVVRQDTEALGTKVEQDLGPDTIMS